jgi:uncharacterized protein (TIGR02391 family)
MSEMSPNPIIARIADVVCRRFINLKQPTSRHELVVAFENTQVFFEMEQHCLLRARNNQQEYLPTAGSFAVIDGELHQLAAYGTCVVLHALKNLFKVNPPGTDYDLAALREHVAKMYPDGVADDAVALGLYLAQDFGVFGGWKPSDDGMSVDNFRIEESVVTVGDPERAWENRTRGSLSVGTPQAAELDVFALPEFSPDLEELWRLLHPQIAKIAVPRFHAGHYADAVEASLKCISEQVRSRTHIDEDGQSLMNGAFSPNAPKLILGDLTTQTGRSMQQGYMQIFAGAMTGIRNPKAHGNIRIDAIRCIHFLFLASLLAHKLDEATDAVSAAIP